MMMMLRNSALFTISWWLTTLLLLPSRVAGRLSAFRSFHRGPRAHEGPSLISLRLNLSYGGGCVRRCSPQAPRTPKTIAHARAFGNTCLMASRRADGFRGSPSRHPPEPFSSALDVGDISLEEEGDQAGGGVLTEARTGFDMVVGCRCPLRTCSRATIREKEGAFAQHPPVLQDEAVILRELGYWVTGTWCNKAAVDPSFASELVDKIIVTATVRDPRPPAPGHHSLR